MAKPDLPNQLGFVAKVLGSAVLISISIKAVGPRLPIAATAAASLAIVLAPAVVTGLFLGWKLWNSRRSDAANPSGD